MLGTHRCAIAGPVTTSAHIGSRAQRYNSALNLSKTG